MAFLIIIIVGDFRDIFFRALGIASLLFLVFRGYDLSDIIFGSNKATVLSFVLFLLAYLLIFLVFSSFFKDSS